MDDFIKLLIIGIIIIAGGVFVFKHTKIGKQLAMRISGTAQEKIIQDASTPEGAAAYYNSAIEAKTDNYAKAVQMLGQMTGKLKTYDEQLRDLKKKKMQYDIAMKEAVASNDDENARLYIRKYSETDEKIQILKSSVAELQANVDVQKENVDTLKEELESLKAEKDKSLLELETSQTIRSLKVDAYASNNEEDKMLEKVRDGVQKAKESAAGHKIAYENSESVQQKRLDQKMRDADIEAKLQELKKASKG